MWSRNIDDNSRTNILTVEAMQIKMASWLTLVFWLVLVLLQCATFVVCVKCGDNEVIVKISANITECRHCPDCPLGYGLSLRCGSTVEDVSKMACVPCTAGVNFSDSHDHSMCKPCHHCDPHQNKTGQCTTKKDETVCGKCHDGYYKEVTGNICKECTWCCEGEEKNLRMPDCQNAGMPENKQCAAQGSEKSCAPVVSDNGEQELSIRKIAAAAVGTILGIILILVAIALAYKYSPKTRKKLRSCFKCLQCCTSNSNEHPSPNGTRNNNRRCTRRGRHRYHFQPSWPFTTGALRGQFNHSHLSSGVQGENEQSTSVPVPVENGETSRDRFNSTGPHHFTTVHSYPGYPIQSNDMSGPRSSLFTQMHERMKSRKNDGFKQFDNEEDQDPSSSDPHCQAQDSSVSVGGRYDVHGSTKSDSEDSRSTQRRHSWNHIDEKEPHPSAKDTRNTSVTVYPPSTEPIAVVPTVVYHTEPAKKSSIEEVLQDLEESGEYSPSKLSVMAGNIPYEVLKDLCPIMNERRVMELDDYRLMGEKMGLVKTSIKAAEQSNNATEYLLDLFDSKKRGTVGQVMAILKVMDRDDAFRVLEKWCRVTHERYQSEML